MTTARSRKGRHDDDVAAAQASRGLVSGLILLWIIACGLALKGFGLANEGEGASMIAAVGQIAEMLLCALPFALSAAVVLMLKGQDDRLNFEIKQDPKSTPRPEIDSHWQADRERVRQGRRGLTAQSLLFGAVTSVGLVVCSLMIVHGYAKEAEKGLEKVVLAAARTRLLVGIGVLAATAASFVLLYGQMVHRASRRDMGARAIGTATKSLLAVVLVAVVLLTPFAQRGVLDEPADALLVGGLIGLLGDRLIEVLYDAIGIVFGSSPGGSEHLESFKAIDGLDEEERVRLAELEITTLQALAFVSPSLVFFSTRYSFETICDWQDQAMGLLILGEDRAKQWRDQWLVRGAGDAQALAKKLLAEKTPLDARLSQTLGFMDERAAKDALERLQRDENIERLAAWKRCTLLAPSSAPASKGSQDEATNDAPNEDDADQKPAAA